MDVVEMDGPPSLDKFPADVIRYLASFVSDLETLLSLVCVSKGFYEALAAHRSGDLWLSTLQSNQERVGRPGRFVIPSRVADFVTDRIAVAGLLDDFPSSIDGVTAATTAEAESSALVSSSDLSKQKRFLILAKLAAVNWFSFNRTINDSTAVIAGDSSASSVESHACLAVFSERVMPARRQNKREERPARISRFGSKASVFLDSLGEAPAPMGIGVARVTQGEDPSSRMGPDYEDDEEMKVKMDPFEEDEDESDQPEEIVEVMFADDSSSDLEMDLLTYGGQSSDKFAGQTQELTEDDFDEEYFSRDFGDEEEDSTGLTVTTAGSESKSPVVSDVDDDLSTMKELLESMTTSSTSTTTGVSSESGSKITISTGDSSTSSIGIVSGIGVTTATGAVRSTRAASMTGRDRSATFSRRATMVAMSGVISMHCRFELFSTKHSSNGLPVPLPLHEAVLSLDAELLQMLIESMMESYSFSALLSKKSSDDVDSKATEEDEKKKVQESKPEAIDDDDNGNGDESSDISSLVSRSQRMCEFAERLSFRKMESEIRSIGKWKFTLPSREEGKIDSGTEYGTAFDLLQCLLSKAYLNNLTFSEGSRLESSYKELYNVFCDAQSFRLTVLNKHNFYWWMKGIRGLDYNCLFCDRLVPMHFDEMNKESDSKKVYSAHSDSELKPNWSVCLVCGCRLCDCEESRNACSVCFEWFGIEPSI